MGAIKNIVSENQRLIPAPRNLNGLGAPHIMATHIREVAPNTDPTRTDGPVRAYTTGEIGQLRMSGWHAADGGEPDNPCNPPPWRDGWHLKRYGVLPHAAPSDSGPVAVVRRLILASIAGVNARQGAAT